MSRVADAAEGFLVSAQSAVTLLAEDAVGARWDEPSALADLSVGGLASHLAVQVSSVRDALLAARLEVEEEPIPLLEHYTRAAWARGSHDDEANVSIRTKAEEQAHSGHAALMESVQTALDDVARLLAEEAEPRVVRMPSWGWALAFDDFLVTRMMEITVHGDDLAVSIGVQPPLLPPSVLEPVLSLLVGVAVLRHGQAAVVRTLARAERAPASIAAF